MAYDMGSQAIDYSKYDLDEAVKYFASPAEAAPVRKPAPRKEGVTVVGNGIEKSVERNAKTVSVNTLFKQGVAYFVILMCCVTALLFMRSQCNDLDRKITNMNTKIANEQSETVRLNSAITAMFSSEEIEKYAEKHGMIKAESYQVTYIDLSDGDEVVVSGGKDIEDADSLSQKVTDLLAYIF